jgi:endoglucanase
MRSGIRQILVAPPLLILFSGLFQEPPQDPPFAGRLHKGINLSGWFVGASTVPSGGGLGDADLRLISGLGFTFVRVPVDPKRLAPGRALNPDSLEALDHALDLITSNGLAVIVDLHPTDEFKRYILSDRDSLAGYLHFLDGLCQHLRLRSPTDLGVELLNEPFDPRGGSGVWDWNAIQGTLWGVVRKALPEHTLILTGDTWSGISGLRTLRPVADANVLYTIHFYQPYLFTHQGANWMASDPLHLADLRGVPYPGDSERVEKTLGRTVQNTNRAQLRDSVRAALLDYERAHWNRDKLAPSFSQAATWSLQHGKRLLLGEFGVYKRGADPADRCRWLRDVRELAEANRFPWAMWEYNGGFGLLDETRAPDKCLTSALGLKSAPGQ